MCSLLTISKLGNKDAIESNSKRVLCKVVLIVHVPGISFVEEVSHAVVQVMCVHADKQFQTSPMQSSSNCAC
jgi:hypothetical protein